MPGKKLKKIAVSIAFGTGIGILSSAVMIFLMASALMVGNVPAMLISPVTVVFLAVGCFCGGFAAAKIAGERDFFAERFQEYCFLPLPGFRGLFLIKLASEQLRL